MNWNQEISDDEWFLIDRYLDGELNAEEKQSFLNRLEQDKDWQEKVNVCQHIRMGIAEAGMADKMQHWHESMHAIVRDIRPAKKLAINKTLKWAAAAAIVILAGLWWWKDAPTKQERLYATYYKADPGLLTVMGPAESYQFDQAMVLYKAGKYNEAANAWTNLLQQSGASDTLHYFIGSAWLAAENYEKAAEALLACAADSTSAFQKDANWFLGLIYLRQQKMGEAKKYIQQSDHPQKTALLDAINQ